MKELSGSLLGYSLDHYELLQLVGGGGMGVVFRALDTRLDRIVAVKILAHERARDAETVRRFRNEAQSAARLDHDNIARVYHVGEAHGLNYIVFEYIEGVNIRDLVARHGPLSVRDVLSFSLQLAHALAHAHGRNVVHRDIKPSNVLITPEGRAKLVDMGLARLHQVDPADDITASGVTLGTFDYISPEQARDPRNADVRSDIYSLGCTIYFMLTGQPPFPEGNVLQKLLQHQGDTPPDPRDLNLAVPDPLARIIKKSLAKDRRKRYQDPYGLISDLTSLADQLGLSLAGVGAALTPPPPSAWRRLAQQLAWLVPLLLLTAGLVAFDQVWSRDAGPPGPGERLSDSERFRGVRPVSPAKDVPGGGVKGPDLPRKKTPTPPPTPPARVELANVSQNPLRKLTSRLRSSEPDEAGVGEGLSVARVSQSLGPDGQSKESGMRLSVRDVSVPAVSRLPTPGGPRQLNRLVVNPLLEGPLEPGQFRSLKSAIESAASGATIELAFTGRHVAAPIEIKDKRNLTLLPAKDHRPVLVFRPQGTDDTAVARQMVLLTGSQLNVLDVSLELDSPPFITDGFWSLFALRNGKLAASLVLTRCTLTIDNPLASDDDVAFLRVQEEPGRDAAMMMKNMMKTMDGAPPPNLRAVNIQMNHCVARGEAVFLQTDHSHQPVSLHWENGLLVISRQLLRAAGLAADAGAEDLSLRLNHVTGNVQGGLCLLTTSDGHPHQMDVSLNCINCILLGPMDAILVEQDGYKDVRGLQAKLFWSGNANFYQGFQTFWKVTDRTASEPAETMTYPTWKKHWEELSPPRQPVGFTLLPEENRSLHSHIASDYTLKPDSPARATAADTGDVGCRIGELPLPPPSDPVAKKPAEDEKNASPKRERG